MILGIGIIIVGVVIFLFLLNKGPTHPILVWVAYLLAIGATLYGTTTALTAYQDKEESASSIQEIENAIKESPNIKNLIANRRPTDPSIKNYELKKWIKSCNEPTLDDQKKVVER